MFTSIKNIVKIILHQNIRSLKKNFDLFVLEITTHNLQPDIIILTEIWINSEELNFFKIPNFISYSKCNDDYISGGIIIYVRESITISDSNIIQMQTADILKIL